MPKTAPAITNKDATGRTQQERREAAFNAIIRTAIKLIADKGVSGLTLAAAGKEAGYSRGIVSYHFGKKDELLVAIVEAITQGFSQYLESDKTIAPGLPMIEATVSRYLDSAGKSPANIRALHHILHEGSLNPAMAPLISRANDNSVAGFEYQIKQGIKRQQIREDINPRAQAIIILSTLRGVMAQWLVDSESVPLEQVRMELLTTIRRNLLL